MYCKCNLVYLYILFLPFWIKDWSPREPLSFTIYSLSPPPPTKKITLTRVRQYTLFRCAASPHEKEKKAKKKWGEKMINHLDAWEWNTFNVGMRHALKPKKKYQSPWRVAGEHILCRYAACAQGPWQTRKRRNPDPPEKLYIYIYFRVFIQFIYI